MQAENFQPAMPTAAPPMTQTPLPSPQLPSGQSFNYGAFVANTATPQPARMPTWNASQPLQSSPAPTWNVSQPLQSSPTPGWRLSQPLQSSPVAGTVRRGQFVNSRSRSNRNRRKLLIGGGIGICILLLATLGGYLFLQSSNQTLVLQQAIVYPTPVPTPPALNINDPHELYQQALARKPLFIDSLNAQSNYDWEAINTNGICTFQDQTLHATSVQGDQAVLCLEQALQFNNIAFQAQVTVHQGDTAGLAIRANKSGNQLYLFGITTTGRYMLASAQQKTGDQTQVIAGSLSTAIKQGLNQTNQLTIIARQHTFYLYVNGQYLTKVNDATATTGQVGVFSGDTQQNIPDATFSQAKVWGV
ncbi:hypothetical protein KDK_34430 [Dictyobacter kobayashii]|uniref:3-keto-disaccharide hydrolase domain-containing protein n=2 Tax=Dictyobacter kobayashii TaxID=2014872 RepID=A0A402AKM0_9CHLR|nr:hypothetical protein KDK_34430 [Dictyobacter kobayashii]